MPDIYRLLSRRTSSGAFIPEVDGIRFLAIIGVLIQHTCINLALARGGSHPEDWDKHHGLLLRLMGEGWFGVELFFVLSGLIVALPFALHEFQGAATPDIRRYFFRRLTRIEPPYILALTAMFLISGSRRHFLPDYLAGLVYSHRWIYGSVNPFAVFTWSLEVEVGFYILAPWLTRIYRIRDRWLRWLLQVALIAVLGYFSAIGLTPWVRSTLAEMIAYFMAGIFLADLWAAGLLRRAAQFRWDLVAVLSAAALAVAVARQMFTGSAFFYLTAFLILLMFAGVFRGRIVNKLLRLRPVTTIGGMCYTIYLWHGFVLTVQPFWLERWCLRLSFTTGMVVYCLFMIPALIAICVPIFLLTEKPFMSGAGSRRLESGLRAIVRPWSKPAEVAAT